MEGNGTTIKTRNHLYFTFMFLILFIFISYLGFNSNYNNNERNEVSAEVSKVRAARFEEERFHWPKHSLGSLIGKDVKHLYALFGQPVRKEPSAYEYTWLIYHRTDYYFQAGILNGEVVTIYAPVLTNNHIAPFEDGSSIQSVIADNFQPVLNWTDGNSSYQIVLSEEDRNIRPLLKFGDVFVQIYIDKINGNLSSVRFMDGATLIKHRSYHIFFQGNLIKTEEPDESEWRIIEQGIQHQIFDLTNIVRAKYGQVNLVWNEKLAKAAFGHSKDMKKSGYFSHDSKKSGSLAQRLQRVMVDYRLGGENIAANYLDGPDVVEAWLNSKGHRETLLNDDYTHLGIGVYRNYFTQNFAQLSEE